MRQLHAMAQTGKIDNLEPCRPFWPFVHIDCPRETNRVLEMLECECAVCRKGEELLCLNPRTLGTRRAGGYGTHVIVPNGRYLLPHEGVPQGLAATYTCSGITAFSALKKTRERLRADGPPGDIRAGGRGRRG